MKNLKLTGILLTMLIVLASCVGFTSAPAATTNRSAASSAQLAPDELDETIREASDYINNYVPAGNFIVILNIQSGSAALSDYIIDELIANAVNDKNFSVVDRQRLDEIRKEQNFQTSGEVDDDQALSIGRFIGAQSIVTGSVRTLGSRYRITVRALDVETAKVQAQFNKNIAAGETIVALMGGPAATTAAGARQAATTSGAAASGGSTAAAPAPAAIANGTYTFWPRPRFMRAGVDINVYLDRIVVRSGYFSVYVQGAAQGSASTFERGVDLNYNYTDQWIIQDLDRPSRTYTGIRGDAGQRFMTFENVTCRRFSLTYKANPDAIFEEINLNDAEYEP